MEGLPTIQDQVSDNGTSTAAIGGFALQGHVTEQILGE
jgi:hypothetical protein